jgi:hypothetical protein
MIELILLLFVLLVALTWRAKEHVEEANEEVRAEVGVEYNEDAAGQPVRDGCMLVLLAVVGTLVLLSLIGSQVPLP